MKVFVVSFCELHEGAEVKVIFSTYERAKAYVDSKPCHKYDWYDITEWTVDKE